MPRTSSTTFRSRRSHKRQQRRQVVHATVGAALVVVLFVAIGFGTRHASVTVRDISISGGETVPHVTIRERADAVLSGSYMLLIPRRFSYLYPHEALIARIKEIPRVRDVSVTETSRTGLHISFSEYAPHGLWCTTLTVSTSTPPVCAFVAEDGYAFADAPLLHGGALRRYVREGSDPVVGEYVFDTDTYETASDFSRALADELRIRIRGVSKTEDGDIVFHTMTGGDILITPQSDIQDVFDNLISILRSDEFGAITPEDFEYIDLRFGSRVYLKESSSEVSTSTTEAPTLSE